MFLTRASGREIEASPLGSVMSRAWQKTPTQERVSGLETGLWLEGNPVPQM